MMIGIVVDEKGQLSTDELIRKHFSLVEKIVQNFKEVPDSVENLENAGYVGLLNAANLYNQKVHKIDFKSYAQILITKEIHRYLVDRKQEIKPPAWLIKLNKKIDHFVIHYRRKYQRFPQISEIADHIQINTAGLEEILKSRESVKETYLIHHLGNEITKIQPELGKIRSQSYQDFKLPIEDVIALQKAFLKLKEIQRNIIYYLFIKDLRQTKAAKKLGLSQDKTEQIKEDPSDHLS